MTTILTQMVARLLFLPALLVALAMLIKGYSDTGDGFTAGVIAALAVLLQVVAFGEEEVARRLPLSAAPVVALVGLSIALAVAFIPVFRGDPIMTHYPPPDAPVAHIGSVELITAVAFDIGVFLFVLGFVVAAIVFVAETGNGSRR